MAGEEWARRIVEKEVGCTVVINDDGSAPGMYDLRIGPAAAPEMAIECVGAVDQTYTETWNIGPAKGPLQLSINGDWIVEIAPTARVNTVKQRIEQLLRDLETRDIYRVDVDWDLEWKDQALFNSLNSIKVTHASCYTPQGTGKVYLTMLGRSGVVDQHGTAVPRWVGEFLRAPSQQDVLGKLERSRALERHAFLIVTLTGAPWEVESYLTGSLEYLPSHAPDLPSPVTGVWVVPEVGRRGLRWDGGTWKFFASRSEGIGD